MAAGLSLGAQANFRYVNKKDGLSQASVFAIAQDSTGFLWFGTRDGLNRYDGNGFRVYRPGPEAGAMVGSDVRALYVDPLTHHLWVATQSGLGRYDADSDRFETYRFKETQNSLRDNVIRTVYRDSGGTLWVVLDSALYRFRPKTNDFLRVKITLAEAGKTIFEFIVESPEGDLLVGTKRGVLRRNADGWHSVTALGERHYTTACFDRGGNLWLGTFNDGLYFLDSSSGLLNNYRFSADDPASLSHDRVRALALTDAGDLWVGTFEGLNFLPAGSQEFVRYYDRNQEGGTLRHSSIRSLLIDRSGKLWIGTYYGGIHLFDERYNFFRNYRHQFNRNSLSANVVSSFAEDSTNNLWIGTEGGGLNYFQLSTNRFTHFPWKNEGGGALRSQSVKCLLLDGEDLWVGTYQDGLLRLDIRTGRWLEHFRERTGDAATLAHNNVYGLQRRGQNLWVLTYGGGLDLLDVSDGKITNFRFRADDSTSLSSNNLRTILETPAGDMWLGGDRGLNRVVMDDDGFPVRFERVLEAYKVYAMAASQRGFWVGTFSGGLLHCGPDGQVYKAYTTVDGLPHNGVFGIQVGEGGELWLSTGDGLSRFDPQREIFNNFSEANGLENLEYNFNAAHRTRSGELFFGGVDGFVRFDPAAYAPNRYVPPVVFTRLLHNNKEVDIGDASGLLDRAINATTNLTFAYGEANFTLEFAALDYFSTPNNRYAYKLEGLDRDWNYGRGNSQATYTIQREGHYAFLLKGGNSDGVWNSEQRYIKITVLPPPWRTWWAYLLYLVGLGLLVYGLIRLLRLRHKIQLQEAAQRQQDELMEMKLRFFTNITHEFRTPLTLILGPLEQLLASGAHSPETDRKLGVVQRNARRLLNLVNQILTFRKLATDHEPMEVRPVALLPFLQNIFEDFREQAEHRRISYTLQSEAEDQEVWIDSPKMEKVFYNLLSNAFKFTPDGGKIVLAVCSAGNRIVVSVTDSGVGVPPELREEIFKRFYERSMGKRSVIKSSGIGLAISRQMVRLHHGDIYVREAVTGGNSQGAMFVVELKRGNAHFKHEPKDLEATTRPRLKDLEATTGPRLKDLEKVEPEAPLTIAVPPLVLPGGPPKLLLVDDNLEIRNYLADIFADGYQIETAKSGAEGLETAMRSNPDIIISDVMMPEMDGLTFCRLIKKELKTSHIPVILLTARSAQLFRLEGLRTGADDYLTKPFHPEELRLRVMNLLANRYRFKESFSVSFSLEPERVEVPSLDEQFLRDVLTLAEENIGQVDYKVEAFARDLAISRTLLFDKLKALTGQTPSKFLKNFRLKRAAQLLRDSDSRIGEISQKVGFRDERYFSDCFKRTYGVAPVEFRKTETV